MKKKNIQPSDMKKSITLSYDELRIIMLAIYPAIKPSILSKKKSKHPVIKLQQKISNALFELGESYKELTMNQKENR